MLLALYHQPAPKALDQDEIEWSRACREAVEVAVELHRGDGYIISVRTGGNGWYIPVIDGSSRKLITGIYSFAEVLVSVLATRAGLTKDQVQMDVAGIQQVTEEGLYLVVSGETFFLAYTDYPWFRGIPDWILECIQQPFPDLIQWPALHMSLSLHWIRAGKPRRFPEKPRNWD